MWHGELPVALLVACQSPAPWGPRFQVAGLEVPVVALWPLVALAALAVALVLTRDAPRGRAGSRR